MSDPLDQVLSAIHTFTAAACVQVGVEVPECCKRSTEEQKLMQEHCYLEDLANEEKEAQHRSRDIL